MCRFCKQILKTNSGANFSRPYFDTICTLKENDEKTRDEINASHLKINIGGMVNRNCPLFNNENWSKCPWYER